MASSPAGQYPGWGPVIGAGALPYEPVPARASKLAPSGTFTMQFCSDVHLEFYKELYDADELAGDAPLTYPLQCGAAFEAAAARLFPLFVAEPAAGERRHLALLGDIGDPALKSYAYFLRWCGQRFERVFVVAGNHEFYGKLYDDGKEQLRQACRAAGDNVLFCDRTAVRVDGVRVLATTLWSRVAPHNFAEVRRCLADYSQIRTRDPELGVRKCSPEDTTAWFEAELAWLRAELSADADTPTVVCTHHAPSMFCNEPDFDVAEPVTQCFCSPLDDMFCDPVVAWCYGHTHFPIDVVWGTARVCSNPAGYPKSEFPNPYSRPFRPNLSISW